MIRPQPDPSQNLRAQFLALSLYLNQCLIGKRDTIEVLLTAMLAGENVFFIGPPGTGKTYLMHHLKGCFTRDGGTKPAKFREVQFSRDTEADDLFGPLDVGQLVPQGAVRQFWLALVLAVLTVLRSVPFFGKLDLSAFDAVDPGNTKTRYVRLEGDDGIVYVPEADFFIMDEPANGPEGVLKALHRILAEGQHYNGERWIDCPLQLCLATSNEPLPERCYALADRFALRHREVDLSPAETSRFVRLKATGGLQAGQPVSMDIADIEAARAEASDLEWTEAALLARDKLQADLITNHITVSTRTWGKLIGIVQASAWLAGDAEVGTHNLFIAKDVLWTHLADADMVDDLVSNVVGADFKAIKALVELAQAKAMGAPTLAMHDSQLDAGERQAAIKKCIAAVQTVIGYGTTLKANHGEGIRTDWVPSSPVARKGADDITQAVLDLKAHVTRAGINWDDIKNGKPLEA
jgi:MoxR-like ATPase